MKADIETYDRGGFTPLLNAAWAGDKYLVRYFLAAGANRGAIGTCHYTKPLAAPDFAGHNAAGWARKQGHENIAKLIELGI
jgi:ankyrin repeat protein